MTIENFNERTHQFFREASDCLNENVESFRGFSFQNHFSKSKEAISKAIEGLKNSALILGAGGLNDMPPLKNLAEQFDRVVLVDVDLRYSIKAFEQLPVELKEKVSLIQADLTGYFGELSASVEKIAQEKLPYEAYISKVCDLLPKLKRNDFSYLEERPSFISSSLLCSQLSAGVFQFLKKVTLDYYNQPLEIPEEKEVFLDLFLKAIQSGHVEELRRLVDEKGIVYFADHFSIRNLSYEQSIRGPFLQVLDEHDFRDSKEVKATIEKHFSTLTEEHWTWSLPEESGCEECEVEEEDGSKEMIPVYFQEVREYQITSLLLSPRVEGYPE